MNKAKRVTYSILGIVLVTAVLALAIFVMHGFEIPH